MKKQLLLGIAALGLATFSGIAAANDSTAEMTTGGLVLKNSRNIDMLDEDLFVSADEIRVDYVFRNQGREDERVIVAFPLPDRDLTQENEGDVGQIRNFRTEVDGRPIEMQVERKAFVGTTDHTALLTRLGLPVNPGIEGWEAVQAIYDRLPAADQQALLRAGLLEVEGTGTDRYLRLLWTVKETWWREQVFPAGREVRVRHRYDPGTGGSVGALLAYPNLRSEPEGRQMIRDYCADANFLAGADRLRRQAGENGIPSEQRVGYILRTGSNWRSPIRNFRLVVDKGDARNIVSFCGQNVRRISPTRFEMRRTNWRPDYDLKVLIIRPYQPYTGD